MHCRMSDWISANFWKFNCVVCVRQERRQMGDGYSSSVQSECAILAARPGHAMMSLSVFIFIFML